MQLPVSNTAQFLYTMHMRTDDTLCCAVNIYTLYNLSSSHILCTFAISLQKWANTCIFSQPTYFVGHVITGRKNVMMADMSLTKHTQCVVTKQDNEYILLIDVSVSMICNAVRFVVVRTQYTILFYFVQIGLDQLRLHNSVIPQSLLPTRQFSVSDL